MISGIFFGTCTKVSYSCLWRGCSITLLVWVDVEVSPEMPRTKGRAFSESNGPIPQDECGSGKLMTVELYLED